MEYKQQYSEMLTKLPFLKGIVLHSQRSFSLKVIRNQNVNHKERIQLSLQRINDAKSIEELFRNIPSNKIMQNSYFKHFMKKITFIMLQLEKNSNSMSVPLRALMTKQQITYLQKYYLEIRSVTSAELNSGASDLITYQLFFKKLKELFGQSYRVSGFEVRATMVAQSLTKITTYEGWQPISLSLLHYMSTISTSSKDQLKKNLSIYFLQYFMSYQLKKSNIEALKKNHNENRQMVDGQAINKLQASNFVDVCSIMLSSSTSRPNKNIIESKLDSLAIHNLNRFLEQVCNQLHIKEVINEYNYASKKQNQKSVINKIMKSMMKNSYLQQINNSKQGKIVVNNKLRFLQIVDLYINALDKDYSSLLIFNQTTYNFTEQITKYLYLIFCISENMSVVVSNAEDKMQGSLNLHKMNMKEVKQTEQINLWKIGSKIIQVLSKNTIKINEKQNLVSIILDRVIVYIKANIQDKQQFQKNKESIMETIQSNIPAIINLITYMPIQILQNYFHKQPLINQHLHELLKLCFESIKDDNIQNIKLLEKDIIKFLKLKKTLIMSEKQLAEWLQIFINRAEKASEKVVCWKLYYFLASTEDKTMEKLIKFDVISEKIIRWRNQLEQNNQYSSFESIMNMKLEEKNKRTVYVKSKEIQQLLEGCWINRMWELEFLKLHGLIVLLGKQTQLQDIVQKENVKSSKFKITLQQMQQLFQSWIKPFEQKYCIFFEINFLEMKSNIQFLDQYLIGYKHMAYFRNYFIALFEQTQMLFQYKLINKILTNPTVENYLLYNQKHPKENHLFYFLTLVMGMGDPIHKNSYFTKYQLSKILSRTIFDDKINVDSKQDDQSSSSQIPKNISFVFNSTIDFLSQGLYSADQWKYFSSFFIFYHSFHQSKDIHVLRFKTQSEISRAAYVQALVENKQKQAKYIDKIKLQYQSAEGKKRNKSKQINSKYNFTDEINNIRQLYHMKTMDLGQGYHYSNINLKPSKFNQQNYIQIQKIIINSFIDELDPIKYHNAFQRRVIYILSYLWQLCLPQISNLHSQTMQPNSKIIGGILQKYLQKQTKQKLYHKLLQFIYRQQKCLPRILYFLKMFGILDKQICRQVLKLQIKQLTTSLICISVLGMQEIVDEGYFTLSYCNSMKQDAYKISSMMRDSSFLMYIAIISCDNKQKLENLEWPVSNLHNQIDKIVLKRELNIKLKNLNQQNNSNKIYQTNKKEQVKFMKNQPSKKGFFMKKQIK